MISTLTLWLSTENVISSDLVRLYWCHFLSKQMNSICIWKGNGYITYTTKSNTVTTVQDPMSQKCSQVYFSRIRVKSTFWKNKPTDDTETTQPFLYQQILSVFALPTPRHYKDSLFLSWIVWSLQLPVELEAHKYIYTCKVMRAPSWVKSDYRPERRI